MRYKIFIIVISIWGIISCTSDDRDRINVTIEASRTVPVVTNQIETFNLFIRDVATLYEASIIANGRSLNEVDEVQSGRGRINFPFLSGNVDLVENIAIRVFKPNNPQGAKEMYYRDPIPFNSTADIALFSNLGDFKDIISNETIDLEVKIRFRRSVPANTRFNLNLSYNVYFN